MVSFLESEAKPEDWPVNDKEAKLEAVFKAVEKFRDKIYLRLHKMYAFQQDYTRNLIPSE